MFFIVDGRSVVDRLVFKCLTTPSEEVGDAFRTKLQSVRAGNPALPVGFWYGAAEGKKRGGLDKQTRHP